MTRSRELARVVLPPVVFGVAFVALWEGAVKVFDLKPYFLPPPSAIWQQFRENLNLIWEATRVSGTNALVGLVVGTVLGVALAFVLGRFRILNELVTPLAIALNAVPIFVLVAVFNNMFAVTSEVPRRLMVTLVVNFIVLVNVAKGLTQVDRTQLELMRSYAASDVAILRKVRVPNAVPYLFTALKIAAPASVITAFVSEYFGGSQNGLGSRIVGNIAISRNAAAWAYVLGACLLGLAFYLGAVALERVASPGGPQGARR
jgi:NitT/TauT family transport system permease protein